jgi:pimeloyl-ACP methyl ester carboxylesterase
MEDLCSSFQLIAPDLRGYGGSPVPDRPFAYHEDVACLLDHLGIDSTWIVGASYGARIAVDCCLVVPERVAGLVLVSPTVGGFEPSEEIRAFNEEEEMLLEEGNIEGATQLNMRMWLDGPYRDPSEIDAILRSQVAQMQREAFQNPIPKGAEFLGVGFVALERLEEIACPVLVVAGDKDLPVVIEHASFVASRTPDARFQLIREVGHMLSLEVPARFSGLLREFIEGTGRTHPAPFPVT